MNAVECCKSYGFESYVEFSDLEGLKSLLNQGIQPIVSIFKFDTDIYYVHSVVIVNIGQNKIEILDPEDGIIELPVEKFDELWSFTNRVIIVVKKKN